MMQISHVLCPVDFSDFSRRVVSYGAAIAQWYRVPLTLLYVHHVPQADLALFAGLVASEPAGLSTADRDEVRRQMDGLLPRSAATATAVEYVVAEGDIADEIVAAAGPDDLIVIGTHGRSGFARFVIGSVTEKVLRKTQTATLTVPQVSPGVTGGVPELFHHILAAVDFSAASADALTFAVSLADEADAHLTMLHVVEVPRYLSRWAEGETGKCEVETWKAESLRRLRAVVRPEARVYAHIDEQVEVGVTYREILQAAMRQHSDLIVIGAHGDDSAAVPFVGSTAQHVLRGAACPVLLVRGARQEAQASAGSSVDRGKSPPG